MKKEPKIIIGDSSLFEQLEQEKIKARMELLQQPPTEAQEKVNSVSCFLINSPKISAYLNQAEWG